MSADVWSVGTHTSVTRPRKSANKEHLRYPREENISKCESGVLRRLPTSRCNLGIARVFGNEPVFLPCKNAVSVLAVRGALERRRNLISAPAA
eukprot:9501961-Pyramimonas_sp.AAC.1